MNTANGDQSNEKEKTKYSISVLKSISNTGEKCGSRNQNEQNASLATTCHWEAQCHAIMPGTEFSKWWVSWC